ncbi:MAG: flagellar hook-basal body complex protein FliE [Rhizomicrobium sp.]
MTAAPIVPVTALALKDGIAPATLPPTAVPRTSFADLLSGGIDAVNTKVLDADKIARAFALDDSIPVHQVTFALEQARMSLELMTQVRQRLLDGYQQLMNMPL